MQSIFNALKHKPTPKKESYVQQPEKVGLLVTDELEKALADCKARVEQIAVDCKARNRKYRDLDFDLETDRDLCLNGLTPNGENYDPADCRRVAQIFDNPQFFIDGATSNDINQGQIGDCWFISALATMSTMGGLIEKFCVARDEQVGVYGFIFFRDANWVTVIIDDLLFTSIPKFEELTNAEKQLYHNNKDQYNTSARKGSKSLYFARSGTDGETWVPLLEKAYAKLHGCYGALSGGYECEGIEDLTGGVSSFIPSKDILDTDKFWHEELRKANIDRLFGCAFNNLNPTRSGAQDITLNGLIGGHAYSVLRAEEYNGKRFVVVRNPWGQSEWTGPWADGSKEWTEEWLPALKALQHKFGDDGEFVMEYKDFLDCWEQIDRTLLFDSSWVMSSQWLNVQTRPFPSALAYGDVSFTFTIPKASPTIIVLSQLDTRYYADINGRYLWTFDFIVFKKGEKKTIAESSTTRVWSRSVNTELNLEAGEYVVHVRLDRLAYRDKAYYENNAESWDERKLVRQLTERAKSQSLAQNFRLNEKAKFLPLPLDVLAGQDLGELEKRALEVAIEQKEEEKDEKKDEKDEKKEEQKDEKKEDEKDEKEKGEKDEEDSQDSESKKKNEDVAVAATRKGDTITITSKGTVITVTSSGSEPQVNGEPETKDEAAPVSIVADDDNSSDGDVVNDAYYTAGPSFQPIPAYMPAPIDLIADIKEEDSLYLGLRVYTKKDAAAVISAQLRQELEVSAASKLAL